MPTATATPREPVTKILVPIHLPAATLAAYQDEAASLGVSVADLIARRLDAALGHRAQKPLYFDDDQRRALESLLTRNLTTPEEAIHDVRSALTVAIDDLCIALPPPLLTRLRTRFFGQPAEWHTFVRERILAGLEEYVGLR